MNQLKVLSHLLNKQNFLVAILLSCTIWTKGQVEEETK